MHSDALTLVTRLPLLALCRLAVQQAQHRCPPPLPQGPGGRPRRYSDESLLLIALLRPLWRLSPRAMSEWLHAWPALAVACGLPARAGGSPWVPRPAHQWKRAARAGAPPCATLCVRVVTEAIRRRISAARDLSIDSAPLKAGRHADPDAAHGHAPAHHPTAFLRGYRVHTRLCRGSGRPLAFRVAPANTHDAPFAQPLLQTAVALDHLRPRVLRRAAASWGPTLSAWIPTVIGATAVIPWNPQRTRPQKRSCLPPTWTKDDVGKRSAIARFFGRVVLFFPLQRPPLAGWSAVTRQVALTYTAVIIVAWLPMLLAAPPSSAPPLASSPTPGRAYYEFGNGLTLDSPPPANARPTHTTCAPSSARSKVSPVSMERSIQSNAARRHAIAGRRWRWHAGTRAATIPPDRFVYDPATPVPTWSGGNIGVTELAGARDQWPIEGRHDVLVYTSDVLREDVELTGTAVVELWAASSAPDTDIVARLVDVAPDGTAYNVAEGIVRARHRHDPDAPGAGVPLEPGEPSLFRIALTARVSQAPRPAPKITSRPRRQ